MNFESSVLLIMNEFPLPANSGGKVDFFYKIKYLRTRVRKLYIVGSYSNEKVYLQYKYELLMYCDDIFFFPRNKSILSILSIHPYYLKSSQPSSNICVELKAFLGSIRVDYIICAHLNSYLIYRYCINFFPRAKKIYRSQNIERRFIAARIFDKKSSLVKKIIFILDYIKLLFLEKKYIKEFDLIGSISDKEISFFETYNSNVSFLPAFFNTNPEKRLSDTENLLLKKINQLKNKKNIIISFVNNFSGGFNVDATSWFIKKVIPLINNKLKTRKVLFIIAGYDSEVYFSSYDGILVLGKLASVKPIYLATDLSVVLTFSDAGVKTKIYEILVYGSSVVSTCEGVVGSGLESTILHSSEPDILASLCVQSIDDSSVHKDCLVNLLDIQDKYFDNVVT